MTRLSEALGAHAFGRPESIALDPAQGDAVSWARLLDMVDARRNMLAARFDPARPVALQLDHSTEAVLLQLALIEAGIPVLSLPRLLHAGAARPCDQQLRRAGLAGFPDLELARPCGTNAVELPAGTAWITFTSGSTGEPRGVCLSRDHMLTVAASVVAALGPEHAGRHLALLPPGILLETVAGLYASLLAGGTYLCPSQTLRGLADPFRPDFAGMLQAIAGMGATSLILVPEYLAGLVAAMEASGVRLPDLTLVAVGGARTPPELIARARALGLPIRQGYGLTECASVVSIEGEPNGPAGSVGKPLDHARIEIAADGEILVHGPQYLGTVGVAPSPGPLATGDLGHVDESGRLWISGRKSNLIVTSFGRNISPEWVEATLTMQPAIAQAMVHGEGKSALEALISPAFPDADIAAAVAAANAALPAYARISAWREVAHFTPDNGMLTGNGRLRRRAIAAAWLDDEPAFFTLLEAATVRQRIAFLAIPQVRAGLTGMIGLETYRAYLAQAWHHVRHTVPLLKAARKALAHRAPLASALDEYIDEESGHDEWILSDIRAAGGHAELVRLSLPAPATAAMVNHAYDRIRLKDPLSLFGMIYVLESVSVALASRGAAAVQERLGLPPQAFTYLTSHGALDQSHMRFFADLVNGLSDPADRELIVMMAQEMFGLFGAMFASIPMEPVDAAA